MRNHFSQLLFCCNRLEEALDLGVRAYNSLKRAGYSTIGELAEAIAEGTEIAKIRNCGAKSCREIMEKLFLYQYTKLQEKRNSLLLVRRLDAWSQEK
ncbi:DNA-directed RNA polymerase subunit alpha C-terminal domain-containing protein [Butyrivibrio sp. VCD2006]|uniref:DNA-directed RNA polymerase subunit alpha C-terminal domain-containing protein n=1 Tax=Butyrivibrio sp. VCD2006 TaxID=1280664 RepID=UPI0003FA2372|nr:DNA-directed RNA polymerase subunit alpha C-terminal domain-containing protein [Butyrivibrio sp. VCD2006]